MPARAGQLKLKLKPTFSHGGRRAGAGRKRRTDLQSHLARPRISDREPVHVTLKLHASLPSLRRKDAFRCLREAVRRAREQGFAVAHFAILSNHVHLILEPGSAKQLGRWMQSLTISFSRRLNALFSRKGAVFADRYHVHVLKTPTEARNAIAYVLTNESLHESKGRVGRLRVRLDPFSSAHAFGDWDALFGNGMPKFLPTAWALDAIEGWYDEVLAKPRTWLLRKGWMRA